jgi:hypothetical protein|tara:strand:+ start:485 stop:715 length:231 start_codon:yes stop_codon:yes gene_type:complete
MTKDDKDIENIGKFIIILLILGSTWFTYYGINLKLNVIMENTNNELVDSLHQEIMNIGWENDSLILKYEHNWEFEN